MAPELEIPILAVDDYQTLLRIASELLSQLGYRNVDVARDVDEALAKLRAKSYRLVISDWTMQPRDGLELLKEIRAAPGGDEIRFILVTAEARAERLEAARLAGADAHLIKPFNRTQLLAAIERVFEPK